VVSGKSRARLSAELFVEDPGVREPKNVDVLMRLSRR
jgi:hypothetical protein